MLSMKKVSIIAFMLVIVGLVGSIITFSPALQSETNTKQINEDFSNMVISLDNASVEIEVKHKKFRFFTLDLTFRAPILLVQVPERQFEMIQMDNR